MIFNGQPGMRVSEMRKNWYTGEIKRVPLFKFDENGEYETEDERLIKKLSKKFAHSPKFKCKECDFTTDNKGLLLAHYREHRRKDNE